MSLVLVSFRQWFMLVLIRLIHYRDTGRTFKNLNIFLKKINITVDLKIVTFDSTIVQSLIWGLNKRQF